MSDAMSRATQVVVVAGGGGVGKTTTSAALALSLARQGYETLIVTIDPACRLAGAMGVPLTDAVTSVPLSFGGAAAEASTRGRLSALMPDPRRSLTTLIEQLFENEPDAKARLLNNRLYIGLSDAAAGIHELVAMNLVARAAANFEVVVIDTAPSRHAIDFVTYPAKLADLLGGRTMSWISGMAERASATTKRSGLLSWGSNQVEALLAKVTGPYLLRDTASMFTDLASVRERFVGITRLAGELLLGSRTSYALVGAPTASAEADILYLARRLQKLGQAPSAIILNRADEGSSAAELDLSHLADLPSSVKESLQALADERSKRDLAANRMVARLSKQFSTKSVVRLPLVERAAPEAVIEALSQQLASRTGLLVKR